MSRKWNNSGYYVMATRQSAYPPSWRWIMCTGGAYPWIRGAPHNGLGTICADKALLGI